MAPPHNLGLAFAQVAARQSGRIALHLEAEPALSFGALDAASNRLARYLQSDERVQRGDVIALVHDKTGAGYIAMLACLKLGAIYLTLDESNPPDRLQRILATAQPRLLLAAAPHDRFTLDGVKTVALDGPDTAPWQSASSEMPMGVDAITGSDPAYLMFTSGSTGHPKGAVIAHGAVLRFIAWIAERFAVTPADVFTGINPPYFDNSVFDFYGGLFTGASLAPLQRASVTDAQALVRRVEAVGCSLWFSVPSMLVYANTMKALGADALPQLRRFVFGGEGFPKGELGKLFDRYSPRIQFVNVYGPTECTCICSAHDVTAEDIADAASLAPLGALNPDVTGLILDESGMPVLSGEAGELWLGGPQVALGYYNDPERSAASFVQNPMQSRYAERFYRSGDMVRLNARGQLQFVGRADNQIKHLGYRIELEEIEAALCRLPYVTQAGVVYRRVKAEYGQIEAFVTMSTITDEPDIRGDLKAMLPAYMIPRRIEVLAELPKNANGKVDRQVLSRS